MKAADDPDPTTGRWRHMEALYHEILAHPPEERPSALAAACPDDPLLAAEVQSLLDQRESAAGFLARPAIDIAAKVVPPPGSSFIGRRIGVFEVRALLGVGGMGEVYSARDTRLGRSVAIKILPRAFTSDSERLARFEREARVLASLNHSNIGTLYGVEEADGLHALVLEFVEGETLGERIKGSGRGSGLPLPEALSIAKQIADALEAAHEKGVVHRDLKPANIMITPGGAVKVLDFGLAKLGTGEIAEPDLSNSPTVTRGGTQDGVILGTAAYMSPEQARAKPIDKRTDIWAFGCVLFEMLTGRAAFGRETVSDTLAAIIEREPDWKLLPDATPPFVTRLLQRCLDKDPRRRLRDIADARADLEEVQTSTAQTEAPRAGAALWRPVSRKAAAGLALAVIIGGGLGLWAPRGLIPDRDLSIQTAGRFTLPLPEGALLASSYPSVAISRDGQLLALVALREGVPSVYVRRIDEADWRRLPGTEGAIGPFFSPDQGWLAFFTAGRLLKVFLAGGTPQLICQIPGMSGYVKPNGDWGADERIVFSYFPVPEIWSVPSAGGTPERVAGLGPAPPKSVWYRRPQVLSDGRGLLFSTSAPGIARVEILPAAPGNRRILAGSATDGSLTRTGHLVYGWDGQLLALPLDSENLSASGVPVPVVAGVRTFGGPAAASDYALSENGTLLYAPAPKKLRRLVWAGSCAGQITPLPFPANDYRFPALSHNGRYIAVTIPDAAASYIWVGDLGRGNLSRLTDGSNAIFSLWSPDDKDVIFSSAKGGSFNVFRKSVDGGRDAARLTTSPNPQRATGFSRDGAVLLFHEQDPASAQNIFALPLRDGKPVLLVGSLATERGGTFSPDGKWLAYDSDESGRYEVYVEAYPGPGEKRQLSTEGGGNPMWNPSGHEIFYTNDDQLLSATFMPRGHLEIGKPRLLFRAPMIVGEGPGRREYDVTADGERFLFVEEATPPELHVVVNWFEELKRRVPGAHPLQR